jgi:hypothetical protein
VSYVRTRLTAKVALILLSLGIFLPVSVGEAREITGSSSSAKNVNAVKTAVKKRQATVTRRVERFTRARATSVAPDSLEPVLLLAPASGAKSWNPATR